MTEVTHSFNTLASYDELPPSAKVCLFGAGERGRNFRRLIQRKRKDVTIACYADTNRRGTFEGVPIISPEELAQRAQEFTLIIITSQYYLDIAEQLDQHQVKNYCALASDDVFDAVSFGRLRFRFTWAMITDFLPSYRWKSFWLRKLSLVGAIGTNCTIMEKVRVARGGNLFLSNNIFINRECFLFDEARISIGSGTFLGPRVTILTAGHNMYNMMPLIKPVEIGAYCWIGANATILPGVKVGDFSIVGAGSVVNKDIPERCVYSGTPAKFVKVPREVCLPFNTPGDKCIFQF